MKAFLDTHAAVFLWQGDQQLFGQASRDLLERAALFVSPVVRLELTFLYEIDRLRIDADEILAGLAADLGVRPSEESLDEVIGRAVGMGWTRDPFDRLLVATADLHQAPFVTRDEKIRDAYPLAVW